MGRALRLEVTQGTEAASVTPRQRALRQQLYETQSELDVQSSQVCTPAQKPRTKAALLSSRPSQHVTLASVQDKRPPNPSQPQNDSKGREAGPPLPRGLPSPLYPVS